MKELDINYNLEKDLIITIRSELPDDITGNPYEWYAQQKFITAIEQDKDNKYKFNILMANGKTINAEKTERWRNRWIFSLGEKTYNTRFTSNGLRQLFKEMFLTLKEQFEYEVKHFDWTFENSDDFRYWRSGENHLKKIKKLAGELINNKEKDFVNQIWNEYKPKKYGELIIK